MMIYIAFADWDGEYGVIPFSDPAMAYRKVWTWIREYEKDPLLYIVDVEKCLREAGQEHDFLKPLKEALGEKQLFPKYTTTVVHAMIYDRRLWEVAYECWESATYEMMDAVNYHVLDRKLDEEDE